MQELPITLDTEHFIFHADFSMRPAYVVGFEPAFLDFMELMREHTRSAINQEVYTLSNGTPELDALISALSVEKDILRCSRAEACGPSCTTTCRGTDTCRPT